MSPEVDYLALANLIISFVTAFSALYIAYVALRHTAKPNITVKLFDPERISADKVKFIFEVSNVGHWYAASAALGVIVNCNFDERIQLNLMRYGSEQELEDRAIKTGKDGLQYLTAKGLDLAFKGEKEQVHVEADAPNPRGTYPVTVNAYSSGGANFKGSWKLDGESLKVSPG